MITAFAPAKVNLALHITGQRDDGYHLLDSLVVFADLGDRLSFEEAEARQLTVTGPFAEGVPTGPQNLIWKALDLLDPIVPLSIQLEKNLPHPAGIGGGSSDAGAVLRAMGPELENKQAIGLHEVLRIGADVPVCIYPRTCRMRGIGEVIDAIDPPVPPLSAVLVNPGVPTPTGQVFQGLKSKTNAPMTPPDYGYDDPEGFIRWLAKQRNDLEPAALTLVPSIKDALDALRAEPGYSLARMSGSGATCFGLFEDDAAASSAAAAIAGMHPEWWVKATTLARLAHA